MVNRNVLTARLERPREYLDLLKAIRGYDEKRFVVDPFIHGTAERNLHLAIECLLDIGNHVISDRGYPKPESYADGRTGRDLRGDALARYFELEPQVKRKISANPWVGIRVLSGID